MVLNYILKAFIFLVWLMCIAHVVYTLEFRYGVVLSLISVRLFISSFIY